MPTRHWIGDPSGQNLASNPADWDPTGAPQPGDSLVMTGGTMKVTPRDRLQDDPLSFADPNRVGAASAIYAASGTRLNIVEPPSTGFTSSVEIHDKGVLSLTANIMGLGRLRIDSAVLKFIGDSTFEGSQQTFNANLSGKAKIILNSASHFYDETMELNGSVGHNLTFVLNPGGPPPALQIDRPLVFHGSLSMPDTTGGVAGHALLGSLHATSAFYRDDLLTLFEGPMPYYAVRVAADSLQVAQTDAGIVLAGATLSDPTPHIPGTLIPVVT